MGIELIPFQPRRPTFDHFCLCAAGPFCAACRGPSCTSKSALSYLICHKIAKTCTLACLIVLRPELADFWGCKRPPLYRNDHCKRWGASPFSIEFCGGRGPFRLQQSTICGPEALSIKLKHTLPTACCLLGERSSSACFASCAAPLPRRRTRGPVPFLAQAP